MGGCCLCLQEQGVSMATGWHALSPGKRKCHSLRARLDERKEMCESKAGRYEARLTEGLIPRHEAQATCELTINSIRHQEPAYHVRSYKGPTSDSPYSMHGHVRLEHCQQAHLVRNDAFREGRDQNNRQSSLHPSTKVRLLQRLREQCRWQHRCQGRRYRKVTQGYSFSAFASTNKWAGKSSPSMMSLD